MAITQFEQAPLDTGRIIKISNMKTQLHTIGAILLMAITLTLSTAHAGPPDTLEVEGWTYSGLKLQKAEPDGLTFKHDDGVVKIPIEKLPADLRAAHALSEEGAAAYRAESEAKRAILSKNVPAHAPAPETLSKLAAPAAVDLGRLAELQLKAKNLRFDLAHIEREKQEVKEALRRSTEKPKQSIQTNGSRKVSRGSNEGSPENTARKERIAALDAKARALREALTALETEMKPATITAR